MIELVEEYGGAVTAVLLGLMEAGEIDGALVATESDEEP
jgi:coenzyme F420 hydrogenase subunit beta